MSDALRALADASDAQFDAPPGGMPEGSESTQAEPSTQTLESPPETLETPESPQPQKQQRQLTKEQVAAQKKARIERDNVRANQANARAVLAEKDRDAAIEKAKQLEAQQRQFEEQRKIDNNPHLKQAHELLKLGYTAEQMEREATKREAEGNREDAEAGRAIADFMRQVAAQAQAQASEAQQAQLQGKWKTAPWGTHDFDQAAMALKPGTPDFNDCWVLTEQNLAQAKAQSTDPFERECAKQFKDPNSEFGKRMTYFLHNTEMGKAFRNHAIGIVPAFDLVRQSYEIDVLRADLAKSNQELNKLRGYTMPAGGGYNGNGDHSAASVNDGPLSVADLNRMPMDQLRARIRSREAN